MIRRLGPSGAAVAALITIPVANVTVAFAQATVTPAAGAAAAATTTTTTTSTPAYGFGNPQSPNGTIGGGNATESSAHPVTGDQEDTFDIKNGTKGASSYSGSDSGPIFSDDSHASFGGGEIPWQHLVRKGDTLWGLCDFYFNNPYQWPRIWSYNPQIQNPHWIYPGDVVHLRSAMANGGVGGTSGLLPSGGSTGATFFESRRQVPNDTIFLRDEGFVEDSSDQDWGELTGSPADKMFLTSPDEVYLHLADAHDVRIGQELTVFRPLRNVSTGKVVQILGTVHIDEWNARDHVARASLNESLDVIERGARVGPLGRRFEVVPPVRNDRDLTAHIVASVHPHEFYGQNQVVFIDKGSDDGLKPGNRLFIQRRGDAWRGSLATPGAGNRMSPETDKVPDLEKTPGTRDEKNYPEETVGELRVLAVKKHTATCMVSVSKAELEHDDVAIARKGY
jgi:hypothetical protein